MNRLLDFIEGELQSEKDWLKELEKRNLDQRYTLACVHTLESVRKEILTIKKIES